MFLLRATPAIVSALYLFCFHMKTVLSGPLDAPIIKGEIEQKGWISILSTIETRLKNLDELYSTQLSPTLETRMQHFQNRINGMEIKLLRVEALLTNKLDRMADNISSKHFRDDMVQTDLFRKMEAAYDGIIHRLSYMDRKAENGFSKMQDKEEITNKRIEQLNDNIILKQEKMENRLVKFDENLEDLKAMFHGAENKIHIPTGKGKNESQDQENEGKSSSKKYPSSTYSDALTSTCENTTKTLDSLKKKINSQISIGNNNEKLINQLSDDLEKMFNDYAVKVSDLGAQVTKSESDIATQLNTMEALGNATRVDMQNGLRTLMIQIGKISKGNFDHEDQQQLTEKLDSNFEKIIATQNQFLESCHRLQMDESQLENQISDVLNKLIDNLSKTMKEQHHSQKKIESLIMKHDLYLKKELYQTFSNIQTLFDQNEEHLKALSITLKETSNNVVNCNGTNSEDFLSLKKILNTTMKQQIDLLTDSIDSNKKYINCTDTGILSKAVELLGNDIKNKTSKIDNEIRKIYQIVEEEKDTLQKFMNTRPNSTSNEDIGYNREYKNDTENENIHNTTEDSFTDLDSLIREVFNIQNATNPHYDVSKNSENATSDAKKTNLDFDIDVRFKGDEESSINPIGWNQMNTTEAKEILYGTLENKSQTNTVHNENNSSITSNPNSAEQDFIYEKSTERNNAETIESFTEELE